MMKNPPHPGLLFAESLRALELGIAEAARRLGMSRVSLSRVANGRAAISSDLALRLETAGLSTARFWMALQVAYDLSHARRKKQPKIIPLQERPGQAV
jgi:addiction module HigA family antidote